VPMTTLRTRAAAVLPLDAAALRPE
jgi:hypothetical protein